MFGKEEEGRRKIAINTRADVTIGSSERGRTDGCRDLGWHIYFGEGAALSGGDGGMGLAEGLAWTPARGRRPEKEKGADSTLPLLRLRMLCAGI